jgi:hypothetical protein
MHKEQPNDAGLSAQRAVWNELVLLFLLRSTTSCRITSAGRATTGQAHDLYAAMPVCLTVPMYSGVDPCPSIQVGATLVKELWDLELPVVLYNPGRNEV